MMQRRLGREGPKVSALGLGLMGMSDFYGPADERESIRVIHAAIERGVTLLDTGDFYGSGHNELLLARALDGSSRRDKVFIQVKFGVLRAPDGAFIGFDGRPQAIKNALAQTLRRLRTDRVDLYMPARRDPQVPFAETIGAIATCVEAGWVRHVGVSEVGEKGVEEAHAVHPIAALQREYSLVSRDVESDILPALERVGAGLTAYGVLSRGLLTGRIRKPEDIDPRDYRAHLPRFSGDNLRRNLILVDRLVALAQERSVTASQLAIAWVLSRGKSVIPLIGARTLSQLEESLAAVDVALTEAELTSLGAAVPAADVAGDRYDELGMRLISP